MLSDMEDGRRASLNYPVCAVCGSLGARYHYGGLVCRSCRVFFFRHVKNNKQLVCKNGGHCPIILGNSRHACAACRFRKCLDANMDYSIVGRKIKSCPSNISLYTLESQEILHPEPIYPSALQQQFKRSSADALMELPKIDVSPFSLNFAVSAPVSLSSLCSSAPSNSFLMAQSFLKGLECYPEISCISENDKMLLLARNSPLFGILSQKYEAWTVKSLTGCILPISHSELLFLGSNITPMEFVILKTICLLSADSVLSLSPDGQWHLMTARARFIALLAEMSLKENPLWPPEDQTKRLSMLLEVLPAIKKELPLNASSPC